MTHVFISFLIYARNFDFLVQNKRQRLHMRIESNEMNRKHSIVIRFSIDQARERIYQVLKDSSILLSPFRWLEMLTESKMEDIFSCIWFLV